MKEEFTREAMLIGDNAVKNLNNSSVALFGLGGVGSYAAEALARSGVGRIMIVDNDTVSVSNINRQLCALQSTVGQYKTEVIKQRLLDINPDIQIIERRDFVLPENIDVSAHCTACESELFFSHRASGGVRGTMLSVISL